MKKATKTKAVDEMAKDLEKTKIDKTPAVKSKNLDVLAEYEKLQRKQTANFVVIGKHFNCEDYETVLRLKKDMSMPGKAL